MKKIFDDDYLEQAEVTPNGKAFVWVIDDDCLYDEVIPENLVYLFTDNNELSDVSDEYPEHDGIVIRFIKNQEELADFKTSEYFGSILLSQPNLVDLSLYPYGRYVVSPNAKFDGTQFIILDRDMTDLMPWYSA